MQLADFVHLRVHTAYSLSAGAIRIKELAGLCKAERMPAVAITDSGNLFGALEIRHDLQRRGDTTNHRDAISRSKARQSGGEAAGSAARYPSRTGS